MTLAKVRSCAIQGIKGIPLEVEVDIADGLPGFEIIGLPDAAVREAKERVRAAIRNSGFNIPLARITVNLAPADLKKEGSSFDLAIAVGLLIATGQIPAENVSDSSVFIGEVSLDGNIRGIHGALAMALSLAEQSGDCQMFLPVENSIEASLVKNITVRGVSDLGRLIGYFSGKTDLPTCKTDINDLISLSNNDLDFSDVKGQETAKRALEIAAAGAHNALFYGPPGSGKTMLARRIPTILPSPALDEVLEITSIHSVAGRLSSSCPLLTKRPFCSPHHSASLAGIIGGGKNPQPGEVSLAHRGVLFFDELPEYRREILEALRQPLEDKQVTVTRLASTVTYPADFMFIGSMNPCPCGNYGDPNRECRCSPTQIYRYRSKLSGPLLDRMDVQVEVPAVSYEELQQNTEEDSSAHIRARVVEARSLQLDRYKKLRIKTNAGLSGRHFEKHCPLTREARQLLRQAFQTLNLSMRAHDRVIKVARTIADLDKSEMIDSAHVAEAVQYRSLDRQL